MSRKMKNKINKQSKQLLKIITIIILLAISIIFGDDILNTTNENTLAQASKTSNNSTILSNKHKHKYQYRRYPRIYRQNIHWNKQQ